MSQCKQCGATLPEDSRYCLQCGTENSPGVNRPAEPAKELDFLKPSLLGGLALAVLSALPLISAGNILCCLWAQAGGGLSVWLLNKQRPGGLNYSDGALGGVLSGLIGAIITTVISIPIQMLVFTPETIAEMRAQFEKSELPPAWLDAMTRFMAPGFDLGRTLIILLVYMIAFGLFAMIGGILTTAIIGKKRQN
jgi:hypothetical protein